MTGLDKGLLAERDTIRAVRGRDWWRAVLLTAGCLGLEYGCLLAALRATGVGPRLPLVLLASGGQRVTKVPRRHGGYWATLNCARHFT